MTNDAALPGDSVRAILDDRAAAVEAQDAKLAALDDAALITAAEAIMQRPEIKRAVLDLTALRDAVSHPATREQLQAAVALFGAANGQMARARQALNGAVAAAKASKA